MLRVAVLSQVKVPFVSIALRTDPYSFFSLALNDHETSFLVWNVRYYYRHFSDHRFEVALSVPLDHGFAIDIGTSYQLGQHDEEDALAVRFFTEFKSVPCMSA